MTIAPNTPFMKQIRNISDVIYESNYEQNFTAQCVLRTHQTHPQEIPGHAATVPRTISVKKKKRVPKCEIVFARAALGRGGGVGLPSSLGEWLRLQRVVRSRAPRPAWYG